MKLLTLSSIKENVYSVLVEIFHRLVKGYAVGLRNCVEIHHGDRAFFKAVPATGFDRTLSYGKVFIRDNKLRVYLLEHTKTGTLFASSKWIVEGEHSRSKLVNGYAMLRAGIVLREKHFLSADNVNPYKSPCKRRNSFDTVGKTGLYALFDNKSVNDYLDRVLFIFLYFYLFRKVIGYAVYTHSHIARLSCTVKLFCMLALASSDDRS